MRIRRVGPDEGAMLLGLWAAADATPSPTDTMEDLERALRNDALAGFIAEVDGMAWIKLGCFWLGEIPLAYLLSRGLDLGPLGAYVAIAVAFSAVAVVSVALFRRGTWKTVKV